MLAFSVGSSKAFSAWTLTAVALWHDFCLDSLDLFFSNRKGWIKFSSLFQFALSGLATWNSQHTFLQLEPLMHLLIIYWARPVCERCRPLNWRQVVCQLCHPHFVFGFRLVQVFAVLGAALITLEYGRLGKSHWCLTESLIFTCRDLWKVFVLGCFFGQVLYMMPCLKAIYW